MTKITRNKKNEKNNNFLGGKTMENSMRSRNYVKLCANDKLNSGKI